jgi:hypothetical protein
VQTYMKDGKESPGGNGYFLHATHYAAAPGGGHQPTTQKKDSTFDHEGHGVHAYLRFFAHCILNTPPPPALPRLLSPVKPRPGDRALAAQLCAARRCSLLH